MDIKKDSSPVLVSGNNPPSAGVFHYLPSGMRDFFEEVGQLSVFAWRFFKELFKPPYEFKELLKQSYRIGYLSLSLVAVTAFIMGFVFTIQSIPALAKFGAVSWVPAMVALAMIREIAPVITALICAGKIGSGIGAELASMRVTEQIDAMEVSGTKPFHYLVVTRIICTTLMIPTLVIFADAVSLLGSFVGMNTKTAVTFSLFVSQALERMDFTDVLPAFIKTFFFGFAIGVISCYKGYNSNSGTEGVGKAANSAVVVSSLTIFIIDMIVVQITTFLYK
jgi:phospholipid/cholesterol/gamma-HCH transport system permease protein